MGKSKKLNFILLLVLISLMTVFVTGSVFACNGGGNGGSSGGDSGGDGGGGYSDSDLPSTGITIMTAEEMDEIFGPRSVPQFEGPVHIPSTTVAIEANKYWLALWQNTEDVGNASATLSQALVALGGLPFTPISALWHGPKTLSRELYAAYRGDENSSRRANARSWAGRQINWMLESVYNSNAVKIMMDRPRGDALSDD